MLNDIPIKIEISCSDELEVFKVLKLLRDIAIGEVITYGHTIEASVFPEKLALLKKEGLLIDYVNECDVRLNQKLRSPESKQLDVVTREAKPQSKHEQLIFEASVTKHTTQQLNEQFSSFTRNLNSSVHQESNVYVINIIGPMRDSWRSSLDTCDIHLQSYYKPGSLYTYKAFLSDQQLRALEKLQITSSISIYSLKETLFGCSHIFQEDSSTNEKKCFEISLHNREHIPIILELIETASQTSDVLAGRNVIRFDTSDIGFISKLSQMHQIESISLYSAPDLFMDVVRGVVGIPAIEQSKYNGESEVVAIFDSGIDINHPDLTSRIKEAISFGNGEEVDQVGHGTHVAGIICGTGEASDKEIIGIAPQAKLISVGIVNKQRKLELPPDLGNLMQIAVDKGAKVINLSWGRPTYGMYNQGSFSLDDFTYRNPEVLIIVAAGNQGETTMLPGVKPTHKYNTIAAPASAKNVLTVGAIASNRLTPEISETWGNRKPKNFPKFPQSQELVVVKGDTLGHIAACSSRGPTDYDSIKPEVVAPGTYIFAPKSYGSTGNPLDTSPLNNNYTFKTGTSMAAPIVSGMALLLREYLREQKGYTTPSSSLLKAILIACSTPVNNTRPLQNDQSLKQVGFPDFDQGFGLVKLKSLFKQGNEISLSYFDIASSSDKSLASRSNKHKGAREYLVTIKEGEDLNVVLTWLDPPAMGVQNNLQLSVRNTSYQWKLGNENHIFKKSSLFDTGFLSNVSPLDKYNTVEKVHIENAPAGDYKILVKAQNTINYTQGYSLAVIGNINGEIIET